MLYSAGQRLGCAEAVYPAHLQRQLTREARSGLAAESESHPVQEQIEPVRATRVAIRGPRAPLGEDASPTLRGGTEETARLDSQPDRRAVPRQVSQCAAIAAMDPVRRLAAVGARNEPSLRTQVDRDPMRTRGCAFSKFCRGFSLNSVASGVGVRG